MISNWFPVNTIRVRRTQYDSCICAYRPFNTPYTDSNACDHDISTKITWLSSCSMSLFIGSILNKKKKNKMKKIKCTNWTLFETTFRCDFQFINLIFAICKHVWLLKAIYLAFVNIVLDLCWASSQRTEQWTANENVWMLYAINLVELWLIDVYEKLITSH